MPDDILIDNFEHGYPHIHPDRLEIKAKNLNQAFSIVYEHITKHEGVNFKELVKDLII